jgi:hypothetical protein
MEVSNDDFKEYNVISSIQNIWSDNEKNGEKIQCTLSNLNNDSDDIVGFVYPMGSEIDVTCQNTTISKIATSYFP